MPDVDEIGGWITGQLPAPIAKYKVPGASIGAFRSGEVFAFAVGVLSHATRVEATADPVFQTEVVHLEGDRLILLEPRYGIRIPQVFSGDDGSGRSLYIHSGRALRRAD
jgi:hypothetical protein